MEVHSKQEKYWLPQRGLMGSVSDAHKTLIPLSAKLCSVLLQYCLQGTIHPLDHPVTLSMVCCSVQLGGTQKLTDIRHGTRGWLHDLKVV